MKLVALACPQCREPLEASNQDIVVGCPNCEGAIQISDEGLQALPASFMAPPGGELTQVTSWQPFWMFEAKVNLGERKSQGGRNRGQEARSLWEQLRRFFIPAWDLSLSQLRQLSASLVQTRPQLQRLAEKPAGAPLTPAIMSAADAANMIEFIVLDIEARRDDYLRHIHYDVKIVDGPHLVALPAKGSQLFHRP